MDHRAIAQLLGNYREFFGGFVVVYLALQLKTANVQAQAAAEIVWTQGLNEILDRWGKSEVRDALRQRLSGFNSLSNNAQVVFHMQVDSLINHLLTGMNLAKRALLLENYGEKTSDLLVQILGTKGGVQYWELDAHAKPRSKWFAIRHQNFGFGTTCFLGGKKLNDRQWSSLN